MFTKCLPQGLARLVDAYGRFLAKYPLGFLITSVLIAVILFALAIVFHKTNNDIEHLYLPIEATSKQEREYFRQHFPSGMQAVTMEFSAPRSLEFEGLLQLHVSCPFNASNVLDDSVIQSIHNLDSVVGMFRLLTANDDNYETQCSTFHGRGHRNTILSVLDTSIPILNQNISFPHYVDETTGEIYNLFGQLGDVSLMSVDNRTTVASARSVLLSYYTRSGEWPAIISAMFDNFADENISFAYQTESSLQEELDRSFQVAGVMIIVVCISTGMFAIALTMMSNCVRAKPWVAISGLIVTCMAASSSFGVMAVSGVAFAHSVYFVPFITIGKLHH